MFYIGHNAINYFFDGSLFVMLINAGVPPPRLTHAGWKRRTGAGALLRGPAAAAAPFIRDTAALCEFKK